MPRTIQADGRTITVPDDATPDEINQIVGPAPSSTPPDPSGRTPTGEPAPGDNRNGFQRTLDNLITPDPRREEWQGPVRNAADSFSRGVAENVLPFISHPLKSGLGVLKSLGGAIANSGGTPDGFAGELLKPMVESAVQDYQDRGPALAIPHMVGQGTGAWATGELGGAAAKPVLSSIASKVAPIMERTGLNIGNSAVDSGLSSYAHGHNPARGLYDADVLPSLSPRSTMLKMENALPSFGERIFGPIEASQAQIPLRSLADSIERPISSARGVANGPGIGGLPESTIDNIHASMFKKAPGASRPIYGPDAGIPFTPGEAADAISARGRLALPPPTEDIPLARAGGSEGRLSQPIRLTQVDRPQPLMLPEPSLSTPMAPGMQTEFPERLASGDTGIRPSSSSRHPGMGQAQYIGEIPGERGGLPQSQGFIRRPLEFPASSEPSPLLDLRHPSATPSDVWKTIRNLDEKTRYRMNQPPEIENANELQGNIRGGLRGNLEEAVPEIREPSRIYGDMQASRPGLNRAMNRGASLRSLFDVPMYPLETTVGNGLYKAGRNLPSLGQAAGEGARYLSPAAALIQELQKKKGVNQ